MKWLSIIIIIATISNATLHCTGRIEHSVIQKCHQLNFRKTAIFKLTIFSFFRIIQNYVNSFFQNYVEISLLFSTDDFWPLWLLDEISCISKMEPRVCFRCIPTFGTRFTFGRSWISPLNHPGFPPLNHLGFPFWPILDFPFKSS